MDDPSNVPPGWESRRERRLWLIAYIVIVVVIGLGAARQLYKLYGAPASDVPDAQTTTDPRPAIDHAR
ncbi:MULTISPECIES: hypothetical protein [Chelatococcus]|uniref:Uncharacterized protein n=1 Tax=Chelatococcus caeni TaxID=1348468 RepID=A0A840C8K3_9HYPH|nr:MULTISPECIES: hypothetical protein [Chelatococcus]ALA17577.1 hypothetical protein AL346_09365 [Chelatococcus sp. CO-6]MBB4019206.1 hypothetical protein [Chelatococcus caeni]